jgi:hypothetical protein
MGSYSGNNSIPIGQIGSSLFSSTLLGQREKFDDYSIFFGGFLEADAQTWSGSNISTRGADDNYGATGQNIYLTNARLYFLSNLGHYVTAQFDFIANERDDFFLGNAYAIFGNLDTTPFFVTAGRSPLSVGAFGGGGPRTGGLSGNFAPGSKTNVSINYKTDTINTNIAVFGSNDSQANFSAGFFYAKQLTEDMQFGFNTGYVMNIAGAENFSIPEVLKDNGRDSDNVGTFNIDTNIAYNMFGGQVQFQTGWTTVTKAEKFNGKESADTLAGTWYGGLNYAAILGGRSTNFGVTYGQTYNSAAIPMGLGGSTVNPILTKSGIRNQLILSAQRAYFDENVIFGPEYVYQKLYNGEYTNIVTLDMSVYI